MTTETLASEATGTQWGIDASHSLVQFKVKHLMITNITGTLGKFEGNIVTEGNDLSTAKAKFSAEVASINTGDAHRDGHLHTADFFDIANHPNLTFESTSFEKGSEENLWKMDGDLHFHGATNAVTLNVEFNGVAQDPWGNTKASYTIEGKISRKEWGLVFNTPLETGGWLLGDDVNIHAEIQLQKQV